MKKKIWISILSLLFVLLSVNSAYGEGYLNSAVIQNSGSKRYKAIRLSSAIVSATKQNFADLLLSNERNEPVPYFINSYYESESKIEKSYDMKLIHSFVKDPDFYYDYTLINPIQGDLQATSIEFTTSQSNFVKSVVLLGSFDNLNWEKFQTGILYSVDNNTNLIIDFGKTVKYTHYRVQINNPAERIEFQSVTLRFNQELQKQVPFIETMEPTFTTTEENKNTTIKINGMKHIRIFDITIETEDMFKRNVEYIGYYQAKELYNLQFNNTRYQDLSIPLEGFLENNEFGIIKIENLDNKPIKINKIIVRRYVDELVFDGSDSNSFLLQFNNPAITQPLRYDISSYKESIIQEGYELLKIGEIKIAPPPSPTPEPKNYRWLFNIILIVVAILLGALLIIRIAKKK